MIFISYKRHFVQCAIKITTGYQTISIQIIPLDSI